MKISKRQDKYTRQHWKRIINETEYCFTHVAHSNGMVVIEASKYVNKGDWGTWERVHRIILWHQGES